MVQTKVGHTEEKVSDQRESVPVPRSRWGWGVEERKDEGCAQGHVCRVGGLHQLGGGPPGKKGRIQNDL